MGHVIDYEPPMGYLFHATLEPFETKLAPASHGRLLWTAESPDVAQAYIPAVGSEAGAHVPGYQIDQQVRPASEHDDFRAAWLAAAGAEFEDVQYDNVGRPKSWGIVRPATWADMQRVLLDLGYDARPDKTVWVKTGEGAHGEPTLLPADFREEGRLFILEPLKPLQLLDLTDDGGDLLDPSYNWFSTFEKANKKGYDGVRLNDYLQSEHFGNFGHVSVGLFRRGLQKMKYTSIPARRFDSPDLADWRRSMTPEFEAWLGTQGRGRDVTFRPAKRNPRKAPFDTLVAKYKSRGWKLHVFDDREGRWELAHIVVPENERGRGRGSAFMRELTRLADQHGATLTTSPSTDLGASSLARLKRFYKSFGFVDNRGRNKDYGTRATMLRAPR